MSRELALSALLSLFLMAGFVVDGMVGISTGAASGKSGTIANVEACVSDAFSTPDLPFLGLQ